jgi:peptidyl-prolyl cis-trans isomerase D
MLLQTIHDKITGWIAGVVIFLIAVPFIFWGIDVGFGVANYAARVDTDDLPFWKPSVKIPLGDVTRTYQTQLASRQQVFQGEVPAEMRVELQDQVLENYVQREILEQHSKALGYRVSDEQVLKAYEDIPQFKVDGKFSHEVATRLLQSQGISPAAFEADQRRELQVLQLQNGIVASAFATPYELERSRLLENEQREITWLEIPAAKFAAEISPDDAAVQAYYEQHKDRFMTPDTVTLKYVELKVSDLAAKVPVTDEALHAYYDSVKDRYVEAEKRRGRHILIQVQNDSEDAAARKKAEEVLAKVNARGDFAKLAREYSQDAGSAAQGGDLGWAERSYFVGPFADALFDMKPGEVRGPVRTQFGYHIIRLEEVNTGKQKTFDEARPELEGEYRRQEAEKLFGDQQEKLADKAFEQHDSLDAVGKDLGLPVLEAAGFTRTEGGAPFGQQPAVIDAAFSEDVLNGENSQPIELEPGDVVVVRVASRTEPALRPLAQVREQVVESIKKDKANELLVARTREVVEQLASGATTWEAAKTELKAQVHGPKWVGRAEADMPIEIRNALFGVPKPAARTTDKTYKAVALGTGDFVVLALSGTRLDSTAESAEQRQLRTNQSLRRVAAGELMGYMTELRKRADVDKNPKAFE